MILKRRWISDTRQKVNILKPANKQVDALISAYVKEHLKLKGKQQGTVMKYLGYEIEEEAALVLL